MADMKFSLLLKADGAGNVTGQLKQVESAVKGIDSGAKQGQRGLSQFNAETKKTEQSAKSLSASLLSIKGALVTLASAAGIRELTNTLTQFDSLRGRLVSVTGSVADAEKAFAALSREAARSPATLAQLTDAYAKLRQRGLDSSIEALRIWQDVAASSQKSIDQWIEAVLDAVTGQGERLPEFGIRMQKLKDDIVISFGDMTLTVKNNVKEIEAALLKIGKAKFSGGIENQTGRLGQLFSNLTDSVDQFFLAIGDAGAFDVIKAGITSLIGLFNTATSVIRTSLIPAISGIKTEADTTFSAISDAWQDTVSSLPEKLRDQIPEINAMWNAMVEDLKEIFSRIPVDLLVGISKFILDAKNLWDVAKAYFTFTPQDFGPANLEDAVAQLRQNWQKETDALRGGSEDRRRYAEEMQQIAIYNELLNKELPSVNKSIQEQGKDAKDTRSELEKLNVPYAKLIEQYSELYGIMPKVTAAVIKAESGFKAMAESGKGAAGLMQVMPSTFVAMLGKAATKITDVNQNIEAGTKYLAIQIKTFGDLPKALAAYNAGPGKVAEAIKLGAREGITWWDAFLKLFPKAAKETGPYIEKVLANLKAYGEGKEEIEAISDAFKDQQEILQQTALAMAELNERQGEYLAGLWEDLTGAQMELLKIQDPEGYTQALRDQERQALDTATALLAMSEADKAAARAMLEGKFAAQDQADAYLESQRAIEEATQMRESWAQSVLQGFDQLWSNMISGAENAMEALQETLKSWLYAIGQWLLKQTLIIPVTAAMFGVSQQSLGGGLLSGGTGGTGGTGFMGGISNIGSWFGGNSISTGIGNTVGSMGTSLNSGWMQNLGINMKGLPNWGFALSAIGSALISNYLFGNKGYSSIGSQIGGMAGTAIGFSLGGPIGGVIGSLLGSTGGGALGSLFGGEPAPKGGVSYWNAAQGAGAAHEDASASATGLVGQIGDVMTQLSDAVSALAGYEKGVMGDFWMDVGEAGIKVAYNSFIRGMQKAEGFGSESDAGKWLVDQIMQDFKVAISNTGNEWATPLANIISQMPVEQAIAEVQKFIAVLPQMESLFGSLNSTLQLESMQAINQYATSVDDMLAIMTMARDVQYGYADSLTEVLTAVQEIQAENEALTATYQRAIVQYQAYRDALLITGKGLQEFNATTIAIADSLATAAGGVDALASLQAAYFENFYTEAERLAAQQQIAAQEVARFNAQLGLMGDAVIDTNAELRAYIESLDLTTTAGQNAYAEALKTAEAVNTLGMTLEETGNVVEETLQALYESNKQLINLWYNTITTTNNLLSISGQEAKNAEAAAMALINVTYSMLQSGQTTVEQNIGFIEDSIASLVEWGNTVKATEDAWNNFADSLQSTIDQLRFSTASPVSESGQLMALDQEIARVQAQYATATGQEQVDLANELASLYQQQLSLGSQVYDRTSQEYMDLYNNTMQSLNSLNLQAQDEAAKQTALLQDIVDSINGFAYWESLLLTQQIEADAKAVQDAAALLQLNETQNALLQTVIDTSIYNKDAIVGALSGVPQYAEGTAYVPQTGLYKLHQGEQVIPVRSRTDGEPVITINLTVNGTANSQDVQTAVRRMLPEIKRSLKRN